MGRHLCNPSMARCRCPMLPFCLDLVARSKQKFVLPSELAGLICRGDRRDLLPLCWPFQLVSVIRNVIGSVRQVQHAVLRRPNDGALSSARSNP